VVLSKSGAHIQKLEAKTNRGTNGQRVPEGVARATPVRPQKRGPGRISTIVPWSHVSRFDTQPCDTLLVPPLAYNTLGFSELRKGVLGLFLFHVCSFYGSLG